MLKLECYKLVHAVIDEDTCYQLHLLGFQIRRIGREIKDKSNDQKGAKGEAETEAEVAANGGMRIDLVGVQSPLRR